MNDRIRELLAQINVLENEMRGILYEQRSTIYFQIKGKRIQFEQSVKLAHRQLKTNIFRWLVSNRPQNLLTGPIIYSMIIPMLLLDLSVSLYQAICFPVYKIAKVRRADFFALDRHHLGYLNWFQKVHCNYCAYAAGLIAYTAEIVARTEQYFCPIKHARHILNSHERYKDFLEYGDAADYEVKLDEFRRALEERADGAAAKNSAKE